jgi:hypothetical protein
MTLQEQPPADRPILDDRAQAAVVYLLYLLAHGTAFTALIGFVLAWMARSHAGEMARTHFTFQIRTVLIGLVYVVVGAVRAATRARSSTRWWQDQQPPALHRQEEPRERRQAMHPRAEILPRIPPLLPPPFRPHLPHPMSYSRHPQRRKAKPPATRATWLTLRTWPPAAHPRLRARTAQRLLHPELATLCPTIHVTPHQRWPPPTTTSRQRRFPPPAPSDNHPNRGSTARPHGRAACNIRELHRLRNARGFHAKAVHFPTKIHWASAIR